MSSKKERSNRDDEKPSRSTHQNTTGHEGAQTKPSANAKEARERQGKAPVQERVNERGSTNA